MRRTALCIGAGPAARMSMVTGARRRTSAFRSWAMRCLARLPGWPEALSPPTAELPQTGAAVHDVRAAALARHAFNQHAFPQCDSLQRPLLDRALYGPRQHPCRWRATWTAWLDRVSRSLRGLPSGQRSCGRGANRARRVLRRETACFLVRPFNRQSGS